MARYQLTWKTNAGNTMASPVFTNQKNLIAYLMETLEMTSIYYSEVELEEF